MTVVHSVFVHPAQSVDFDRIQLVGDKRFRVRIRRDSYVNQSYATCDVWANHGDIPGEGGWTRVLDLPGADDRVEGLPTSYALRAGNGPGRQVFDSLANDMVDTALKIVG